MNDVIGHAEQELGHVSNKDEARAYHRRWLGAAGALRAMAARQPALSHYYRSLYREWRRTSSRCNLS